MENLTRPSESNENCKALFGKRILVVDDNDAWLDLMETMLDSAGFTNARIFNVPARAYEYAAKSEKPLLVITDFVMPGMTGSELLLKLDALYNRIEGIILTVAPENALVATQRFPIFYKGDNFLGELLLIMQSIFRKYIHNLDC